MQKPQYKDLKKTKASCPKCKSKNLIIIETSEAFQEWTQEDGVIDKDEGIMTHGFVIRVNGKCDECGHKWKFKCWQIDDLIIDD